MGFPSPDDIMAHVTSGFTSRQLQAVRKVSSPDDIPSACPQNFNLFSQCFAAVAFNVLPTSANDTTPYDYTIRADGGLFHIDVVKHTSDYERRILPLQWALDSVRSNIIPSFDLRSTTVLYQAIIELRTGVQTPTPLEWPFTRETNAQQALKTRLSESSLKYMLNYS